ncbi:MAG TPA: polysaccharide deacetylase family protein [Hyphomonadaceae bacterium]|nr:polysaccharide deacetylase family protein [Hyphomonadaceae bacterium]
MKRLIASASMCVAILGAGIAAQANAAVVNHLPTSEKVIAITFDACEAGKPAVLDEKIVGVLKQEGIPFTVFLGGRFVRDNAAAVEELAKTANVEFENHSWSHPKDMRELDDADVQYQVTRAAQEIEKVTGRKPKYFRFPGGNDDDRTISLVEGLGYRVVHWDKPSADPDPKISVEKLSSYMLSMAHPGAILVFHINGRGVETATALPGIIAKLKEKGYSFVKVDDVLGKQHAAGQP